MILDPWDQNLFTLLKQVFLDRADVLNVTDILIESWVNGHVFCPNCKSFTVLVLVLDVEDKWDASWVSAHHLLHEIHSEVDALDHNRLVALVEGVDYLGELFCD